MSDTIPPDPRDATAPDQAAADDQLDGFEKDLDAVATALDALDADDLSTAESIVEELTSAGDFSAADSDTESDS